MMSWLADLQDNPLFHHLTRTDRSPSLRTLAVLVGGLALTGILLAVRMVLLPPRLPPLAGDLLMMALAGLIIAAPALVAVTAARLTHQQQNAATTQLVRLTLLTPRDRVAALAGSALYRLRLLLATIIGLTPLLGLGMLRRTKLWTQPPYPYYSPFSLSVRLSSGASRYVVWRMDRIGWQPEFYGWLVGMWGVMLLGAALGVLLAIRVTPRWLAAGAAALVAALVGAGLLMVIPLLPLERWGELLRAGVVVAYALGPLEVSVLLLRHARRHIDRV